MNSHDARFMRKALSLAAQGKGKTGFRPLVGCVIVKNGRIIAHASPVEGGIPHVEAIALRNAGKRARGATVYVNLEPCSSHAQKKAPACCEALARAGVARVVYAMDDPHRKINGKGAAFLRKSGVRVAKGVLSREAQQLNARWILFCQRGRPFITLKMACTIDGKIWSKRESRISNELERAYTHRMRGENQAILVGVGTVIADNPRLTARIRGGRDPLRVILDSTLRVPPSARVFADANAIVFTTRGASAAKRRALERKGIRVLVAGTRNVNLAQAMRMLAAMNIGSVMVEGGSRVAAAFVNAKLVDAIVIALAPKIFGDGVPLFTGLKRPFNLANTHTMMLGDNAIIEGTIAY